MDEPNLREILDFAVEAAQVAGAVTLGYFNANTPFELKADATPVSAADRGSEKCLRGRIEAAFPEHGIVGEEFGETRPAADARWIIDPLDGTYTFLSGVPLYSVLVGFEWRGEVVAGVIHFPALKETLYAARGLGCWWNGRRARVSEVSDLGAARLSVTSTKLFEQTGQTAALARLRAACKADRGWPDSYGYACLATGRVEVAVDPAIMKIWDSAALLPVVTEAGGTFTDWTGRKTHTSAAVVGTNGRLLGPVLELLNERGVRQGCGGRRD